MNMPFKFRKTENNIQTADRASRQNCNFSAKIVAHFESNISPYYSN